MKAISKIFFIALAVLTIGACDKVDDLPLYGEGETPELSALNSTIAPVPADSLESDFVLNWSSPNYATDSSSYKYIIEIDSATRNFTKAVTREVIGTRTYSMTNREFNNILLGFGMEFNKQYDVEVRVISSYGNNNERRFTDPIVIKATPYKVPPKVALPTTGKLYIVGSATQLGWVNVPGLSPTQELTQIDETTFGGVFNMYGGNEYLVLPVNNGNWDNKYAVPNKGVPNLNLGGDFGFNVADNFPGPSADGLYKLIMDFQSGKFQVTNFTQQHGLPDSLVIVGGATPGGWTNPVPAQYRSEQVFTRINSTRFEIPSVELKAGEKYLILPRNGDWGAKYGVEDNTQPGLGLAGVLKPEGQDIPAPDQTGNYKIVVDFINNKYWLTKL
jgi:hypothetical protein